MSDNVVKNFKFKNNHNENYNRKHRQNSTTE